MSSPLGIEPRPSERRFHFNMHYAWIVTALAFATAMLGAGTRSAPSVFIHPFELEFGWSRAAVAGAISVNLLIYGLGAPVSGRLIDRFGLRPVMTVNLCAIAAATALIGFMSALWQLSLWGLVVGLAAGGGSVLSATIASRWFVARRGLVVGLLGTASSTGQVIFVPLLMLITVNFGWRGATTILAMAALVVLVPVALLMRDDPARVGLKAFGADASRSNASSTKGQTDEPAVPLLGALRTLDFWLLAGCFFVCGATSNGLIGTHLIPHAIDHGIPEVTAAATVGLMGGLNFLGTLGSGYLTDKIDPRKLLAGYFTFRGASLFVLPFVTFFPGLLIFAVLFGLDWFATVPPVTTLTAQKFGRKSIGTIYGWIFFAHQVGAATVSFAAGAVRTSMGDYETAFIAGGVLCLVGASLALVIRTQRPEVLRMAAASGAA